MVSIRVYIDLTLRIWMENTHCWRTSKSPTLFNFLGPFDVLASDFFNLCKNRMSVVSFGVKPNPQVYAYIR